MCSVVVTNDLRNTFMSTLSKIALTCLQNQEQDAIIAHTAIDLEPVGEGSSGDIKAG